MKAVRWLPLVSYETSAAPNFDFLIRVEQSQGHLAIKSANTAAVEHALRAYVTDRAPTHFACRTLGRVIDTLKVRERYNAHYRDFLLGHLEEAEFEKVAKEYAYTVSPVNPTELASQVHVLLTYTTEDFSLSEVAEIFRANDDDVRAAVEQLQLPFGGVQNQATGEAVWSYSSSKDVP
jgi:hypothetical protein